MCLDFIKQKLIPNKNSETQFPAYMVLCIGRPNFKCFKEILSEIYEKKLCFSNFLSLNPIMYSLLFCNSYQ